LSDLQKFYQSILNIRQQESAFDTIKSIVQEERNLIYKSTTDLTGYCKYIATQISTRLKERNIKTYQIDLKDIVSIDHTILIAEYLENNNLKRILIDPTYSQFTKNENYKLINLSVWPSEKLDKNFLTTLLNDGIIEIDDVSFKHYLNSFGPSNYEIYLDDLLYQQLGIKTKR